jgi:hypothetical protein
MRNNAAGLWAEEDRKTVLDMDIPKTMLDFAYVQHHISLFLE